MDNVVNTPPMGVSVSSHSWGIPKDSWGIPKDRTQPEPEGMPGHPPTQWHGLSTYTMPGTTHKPDPHGPLPCDAHAQVGRGL